MATVVTDKNIEWDVPSTPRRKFPWEEWVNGKRYQAVAGVDFSGDVGSFKIQLKNRAKKDGTIVQTKIIRPEQGRPASVIFQFSKK